MITILKGKDIIVEWKVLSLDTKQPVDFEGVNAKVFLLAPDNIYTLPFGAVRDDFRGLRMTIPTDYISTGVYDLKVIWLKDALKDKPVYRNVSVKREVFALTDEASEVNYDGDTIKIATGVESCGRDGLSAYEIAVFRGFAKESSEKEWVESLDVVLASEASRVKAEEERVKAEEERVKAEDERADAEEYRVRIFTNNEQDRRQSFEISQSNRDSDFQNFLYNKEQSYITAENNRDSRYHDRELYRDDRFDTEESARNTLFLNNEQSRNKAEEDRKSIFEENEANRQSTFQSNEDRREEKETLRGIEEEKRDNAETIRKENETKRVNAEISREERTAEAIASIANKVDRDDNAPKLTAGFANNLVGRGEATSQEISFRPSGGDTSIEDGTARIDRVKGSTVVWNQLVRNCNFADGTTGWVSQGASLTVNDGVATLFAESTESVIFKDLRQLTQYDRSNHKYYISASVRSNNSGNKIAILLEKSGEYKSSKYAVYQSWTKVSYIHTLESSGNLIVVIRGYNQGSVDSDIDFSVKNVIIIDLTQMFGAGNEPATIEEFHARKPIGIDEYAYNEGELISNNVEELKSVGFNAWDEEWEEGTIGFASGNLAAATNRIRSKNYCRCLPNTQYYNPAKTSVVFYDEDYKYVSYAPYLEFVTPNNAHWFKIATIADYGATYKGDICINLVHTGYRNGEYEPYKEFRRSIPIKAIKDKDGNQLFPNGLLSAGRAHDEITATKAIKRIGVLDMGKVLWRYETDFDGYVVSIFYNNPIPKNYAQMLCERYPYAGSYQEMKDKEIGYVYNYRPFVRDSRYTDAATFTAAMSGVMLLYELAEPIEIDLPEPLNLDYEVSDFGTEEVISDAPTTPMKADIIYQFNAVDRIRDNSRHTAEAEIKLANYEARIAALEAIVTSLTSGEV